MLKNSLPALFSGLRVSLKRSSATMSAMAESTEASAPTPQR